MCYRKLLKDFRNEFKRNKLSESNYKDILDVLHSNNIILKQKQKQKNFKIKAQVKTGDIVDILGSDPAFNYLERML